MGRRAVAVETMEIGKKGGRKHWTAAELAARESAAETFKRPKPKRPRPPSWLGDEALLVWRKMLRQTKGLELLDVLDEDNLAVYCDAVVQYQSLTRKAQKGVEDVKAMQSWARIIANYADRLGFTPTARARLVKRRADKEVDAFGREFD